MKILTKSSVLLSLLVLSCSPALAQQMRCGPKDSFEKMLMEQFGESHLNSSENGYMLYGNCNSGSWTIAKEAPEDIKPTDQKGIDGVCVVNHGNGLENTQFCLGKDV